MDGVNISEIVYRVHRAVTHGITEVLGAPTTEPLTGLDYIWNQLREVFIMFACGASIGLLFQIYNNWLKHMRLVESQRQDTSVEVVGNRSKGAKRVGDIGKRRAIWWKVEVFVCDLVFCAAAGVVAAQFWFVSSYGRISLHETGGLVGGLAVTALLYGKTGKNDTCITKLKPIHTLAVLYVIILIAVYMLMS